MIDGNAAGILLEFSIPFIFKLTNILLKIIKIPTITKMSKLISKLTNYEN